MVCIQCGENTQVTNSRLQRRNNHIWRRRRCTRCGSVFTTSEVPDYGKAWRVHSPSGRLTAFSRDKLLLSLYDSCQHRSSALEDASGLAETVIRKLQGSVKDGIIESKVIVQTTLVALNRFDKAAGVRYDALHPR